MIFIYFFLRSLFSGINIQRASKSGVMSLIARELNKKACEHCAKSYRVIESIYGGMVSGIAAYKSDTCLSYCENEYRAKATGLRSFLRPLRRP